MIVKELLDRKRSGQALTDEEIRALIAAYARDEVPDYQMAAFAMAVCCRGMTDAETYALTDAMTRSGAQLTWDELDRPTADKHSTGGVGDKLSLVVQPLAASCGVAVPSLTGRGLGHTGGTADKMETIPGYRAGLSLAEYRQVVAACGCSLAVQTAEIAPADKRLYALRDVTGTVPSIPLICGSILSKKLAEGAGTLVFDVKCGTGAFMKTLEEARTLACALVSAAQAAGRRASALITRMDEPLGACVGNANEVREALEILDNRASDLCRAETELSVQLAAEMVHLARGIPREEAEAACRGNLAAGRAKAVFEAMVRAHGGDLAAFARQYAEVPTRTVKAPCGGYVASIDALVTAQVALELGAGRQRADDAIDPAAGVTFCVKAGDRVEPGMTLATVSGRAEDGLEAVGRRLLEAFSWASEAPVSRPLLIECVR